MLRNCCFTVFSNDQLDAAVEWIRSKGNKITPSEHSKMCNLLDDNSKASRPALYIVISSDFTVYFSDDPVVMEGELEHLSLEYTSKLVVSRGKRTPKVVRIEDRLYNLKAVSNLLLEYGGEFGVFEVEPTYISGDSK